MNIVCNEIKEAGERMPQFVVRDEIMETKECTPKYIDEDSYREAITKLYNNINTMPRFSKAKIKNCLLSELVEIINR